MNNQKFSYGTREWFEYMFSTNNMEDRWGHQWRASQKYRYSLTLSLVVEKLKQKIGQEILDIGCGLGDFTNIVYDLVPSNILLGVDISENAVRRARKKYPQLGFEYGALPEILFNEKFDGIIALECICYLDQQDRKKAFESIGKALKTEGWFLFSSPLDDGVKYFSEIEAIECIENAGFKIKKIIYNRAKLYTFFEKKLLFFVNLRNFVEEMLADRELINVSFGKKIVKRLLNFPVVNVALPKVVILTAWFVKKILSQISIVNMLQFLARIFLRNKSKSHIIILAEKK